MIPIKDNIKSHRIPFINYFLILLNVAVFVYEIYLSKEGFLENFIHQYGIKPFFLLTSPLNEAKTLISSMFLHAGWLHFIGNMLYLYIFGDNVEDRLGHFKYLIFYIFCGISAAIIQIIFSSTSKIPLIGASGAIAGILGCYLIFFPSARVLTIIPFGIFIRIVQIPAFVFLGLWFLLQMYSGTMSLGLRATGGIAWWAHSGGFIVGVIGGVLAMKKR